MYPPQTAMVQASTHTPGYFLAFTPFATKGTTFGWLDRIFGHYLQLELNGGAVSGFHRGMYAWVGQKSNYECFSNATKICQQVRLTKRFQMVPKLPDLVG